MRILARVLGVLVVLAAVAWLVGVGLWLGWLGGPERDGVITAASVPPAEIAARAETQHAAAAVVGVAAPKQILFGDLHAHTTFSFDAFLMNLPIIGGAGAHPPADACDFARFCSGLDFWSINDHAENLSQRLWSETVDSVRQCNAVAGDEANPDLVTYLGWEWSQMGRTPDLHYGHKNVVLRDTEEGRIPTRPIGAGPAGYARGGLLSPAMIAGVALTNGRRGRDFAWLMREIRDAEICLEGVPVRELPLDCLERAPRPEQLFAKLADWGLPSIVIPHGTAWGIYTPAGSGFSKQLPGHDPSRERLVEVYSGHGNSEEYRSWRATEIAADGSLRCPEPSPGYLPSCWRSGELIRERCLVDGEAESECARRAVAARQHYVDAWQGGWTTAPGHAPDRWLDAGQCSDCFQPAFNYRPASSAQAMLAVRDFSGSGEPKRFEFGFIGSSDNHVAKPGTGYKEFWRGEMTEARGFDPDDPPPTAVLGSPGTPAAESTAFDTSELPNPLGLFENERSTAFFVTGGLAAVHAVGRDRHAIFAALERREVYATSGPRILLWFDHLGPDGSETPMGSSVRSGRTPRFRARAVGSLVQKPGCPETSTSALAPDRLDRLCRGECYHPSDERRRITRIEVVRIRPQNRPGEPLDGLVADPWRTFPCTGDPTGCVVEFDDPDFAAAGRDNVYYVRAIEEESTAIHGSDPLRCSRDAAGRCIDVDPCNVRDPRSDDCLAPTEQRAWSSPIHVGHGPTS